MVQKSGKLTTWGWLFYPFIPLFTMFYTSKRWLRMGFLNLQWLSRFFSLNGWGFSANLADFETQKEVEVPDFGIFLPLKIESNWKGFGKPTTTTLGAVSPFMFRVTWKEVKIVQSPTKRVEGTSASLNLLMFLWDLRTKRDVNWQIFLKTRFSLQVLVVFFFNWSTSCHPKNGRAVRKYFHMLQELSKASTCWVKRMDQALK